MSKPEVKRGYCLELKSQHGTFFACGGEGLLPLVFGLRWRAVKRKRKYLAEGFTCRVVPVTYSDPVAVPTPKPARWFHP